MSVLDVELRCKKQPAATNSPNCCSRLTESSTFDYNTEDPSGYLDPTTLCRIHESDFFTSADGDISAIDDSIADAIDFGNSKPAERPTDT